MRRGAHDRGRIPSLALLLAALLLGLSACGTAEPAQAGAEAPAQEAIQPAPQDGAVTQGTETYRGFQMDNVLHHPQEGDIHYHLHLPEGYDGTTPCALFVTLPGYEGLYFQGVGANLYGEDFAFTAQDYLPDLIVAAPQLSDWGETSARQTIALTGHLLAQYAIDPDRVYLEGYSGGGETGSLVLGLRPDLYTAYLAVSTQWDGDLAAVAQAEVPVYLAVGEADSYYGSEPLRTAYAQLRALYEEKGLSQEAIDALLVLDVRDQAYFTQQGYTDQHAGGGAFASDPAVMGWLFQQ